ncbi:MAG: amino acid--tRNA ligase-related protein, partial [Clostridia bacterium]
FNQKAYLAQSPQFYKQMAMASGFEKVFEIGPVFRAEESFTARHTTEFTGIDCEISYINSHYDLMNHQEDLLIYAFKRVKEILGEEINKEFGFEFEVPKKPFPKITMKEAYEILNKNGINKSYEKDGDFDTESEKFMGQYAKEHFGHDFLFVTNYPKTVRPFYHMMNEDDPTTTKSYDLIYKGTEITTGAQREHRYEILKEQALAKGLTLPNIQFYLDFFKYGCPPHGGMGMGLARILMLMLCLYNIRETTYIFRGPTRITP